MTVTLEHPNGCVLVEEVEPSSRRVSVEVFDSEAFVPFSTFETAYPVDLIEQILALRGPAQLGYSILREEDPVQLKNRLGNYVLSYLDASELEGKRALDFGCGSGSSTVALGELFPRTEFVAIDLEEGNVAVARLRARYRNIDNVTFLVSPGPTELPPDIGTFDAVFMTAVIEHLYPEERRALLPQLWRLLRPGGVLLASETPHRYYPIEYHTTALPLLNYVPARPARWVAERFSGRIQGEPTWEQLLRSGIRGSTDAEILRLLRSSRDGEPLVLAPRHLGHRDQVDIWYSESMARRPLRAKTVMRVAFKGVGLVTRRDFVPALYLAVEKRGTSVPTSR